MPLADTDFVLNKLNTELSFVIVTVIVSALPESSDTNIDFTMAVVAAAQVYNVVRFVGVKSHFAFRVGYAINLQTTPTLQIV